MGSSVLIALSGLPRALSPALQLRLLFDVHANPATFVYLFILIVTSINAVAVGLMLSTVVSSSEAAMALVGSLPLFELTSGHWERAGRLRAKLVAAGRRAPLSDTLIAQVCLDHDVPLITRDATRYRSYFPGITLVSPN